MTKELNTCGFAPEHVFRSTSRITANPQVEPK